MQSPAISEPSFEASWSQTGAKNLPARTKTVLKITAAGLLGLATVILFSSVGAYMTHTKLPLSNYTGAFVYLFLFLSALSLKEFRKMAVRVDSTAFFSREPSPKRISLKDFPEVRHEWADLDCVRFQRAEGLSMRPRLIHGKADCLVFEWKNHAETRSSAHDNTTYVPISYFSDDEREQLFLALSRFVPQEVLAPEVLYLQVSALSGNSRVSVNDFTNVWLDQYTRNFELSNFIPLSPGSSCGNGRFVIAMPIAARVNSATYLAIANGIAAGGNGQKVIIKELLAPTDSDDILQQKVLQQFNREAAILAALNHPGIVSIIDHFIEHNRSYIVMPHAKGKNLRQVVGERGPFSSADVVKIAGQLADVLVYLHDQEPPILHRDFTPDNLMYADDGTVTVIDFGAANVYNSGKTATLIGKQSYMPPEQIKGKPLPASDIYAFGATLAFLLSGKDMQGLGKLPQFDRSSVSPQLMALIEQCTAFDAAQRPKASEIHIA